MDIWKFDCTTDACYKTLKHGLQNTEHVKCIYALNINKESFDIIEKFVYDIAKAHFERLGLDINKHYIEFWYKKQVTFDNDITYRVNNFHVDCDENERTFNKVYYKPLLSCVSYLSTNDFPTIVTKVSIDDYKFKNFDNKKQIYLIFPEEMKQITFDGTNFHGVTTITTEKNDKERFMFAINLWDRETTNTKFYQNTLESKYSKNEKLFSIVKTTIFKTIKNEKPLFDFDFYEKMLYRKKDFMLPPSIINAIDLNTSRNYILTDTDKIETESDCKKKQHVIEFKNCSRFAQRFQYARIFSPDICRYIVNQSNMYMRDQDFFPVDQIQTVLPFILESLTTLIDKVKESYQLSKKYTFNIKELIVARYNKNTDIKMHQDNSTITFNILLSNPKDFEGGENYFEDELVTYLQQGDLSIFSNLNKYAAKPVTKGLRYTLIGFLDIQKKDTDEPTFDYCALDF